jgi:hypothetical protein
MCSVIITQAVGTTEDVSTLRAPVRIWPLATAT